MRVKTKMENLVLCDNEGVTWRNNCDFLYRQCQALSEGKLLMITGEGDCSVPIDGVGQIGDVKKIDAIGSVEVTVPSIAKINDTIPKINDISKVTVGPLDSIGKLDEVDVFDAVDEVDAVPTIPNKRPPIPTPKKPRTPRPVEARPRTINPRIGSLVGHHASAAPGTIKPRIESKAGRKASAA